MHLVDRFLNYVSYDTQSDDDFKQVPSTLKQLELGKCLVNELLELGITDAHLDEFGIVYGTLKANVPNVVTFGLIAHMDTSPDCSGKDIKPRIIEKYDGKDIKLNATTIMEVKMFPSLKRHLNKSLIVTDGTTLLGADDKAGIAEIMSFISDVKTNNIKHGDIKIAFTPDEEIGHGSDNFNVEKFGAAFAFTLDGGEVEMYEYENFNAASCEVIINGRSVHPGSAKDKMLNASMVAIEFAGLLPALERPEFSEGYEGFNHLTGMKGTCERAEMSYIIRNHDKEKFERQKDYFKIAANFLNAKYGNHTIDLKIEDTYYNMIEILKDHMDVVDLAKNAINSVGLVATKSAIRGGTDGARLTYDGLPCPNIGTGGYNYHGRFEYACIDEMEKAVEIIKKINELNCEKAKM